MRMRGIKITCWYWPGATVGQSLVLQSPKSDMDPGQSRPPLAGAGLSQVRDLDHRPPPQVTVHVPHCPQLPQEPSTVNQMKNVSDIHVRHKRIIFVTIKFLLNNSDLPTSIPSITKEICRYICRNTCMNMDINVVLEYIL